MQLKNMFKDLEYTNTNLTPILYSEYYQYLCKAKNSTHKKQISNFF